MLDILCDFLMIQRVANGGVQVPNETNNNGAQVNNGTQLKASSSNNVNDTSTVSTNSSQQVTEQRKAGSQARKPVTKVAAP